MDIQTLGQHWETFARTDPLGAILGFQDKRNRNWHPEDFFRHGEREIAETMAEMEDAGIEVRRGRALDFGCGAGRLTQGLAGWFETVNGVDISSTMIDLARHYNRAGDRCQYHLNEATDLTLFPNDSFDFILTRLVLQHMRPDYIQTYIREFMRILAPGGVAAFQMLARPLGPSTPELAVRALRDPLPDAAFRADIVPDERELVTQPGFSLEVGVTVRNASDLAWPDGTRMLRLGNHWLAQDGTMLKESDARAPLPVALAPGEETHLTMRVRAPAQPGEYLLELDLVQEFVSWFAKKGSPTAQIRVTVEEPPDKSIDPQSPVLLPGLEMYAVPRATVEAPGQPASGQVLRAAELAAEVRRDPLPDAAFRADIVPDRLEFATQPSFSLEVGVTVRNASSLHWPDGGQLLRLGNHWLALDGTMLKESEARAPLPLALAPGEETHIAIRVRAPVEPGEYLLELDLVQEFVSWFARKGSPTAQIRVTVEEHAAEATEPLPPVLASTTELHPGPHETVGALDQPVFVPKMEMHAMPRATVEALVQSLGGEMLLVRDDDAGDPNWESLRYYVRKITS